MKSMGNTGTSHSIQRRQVETVFSMITRNQGDLLRARTYWSPNREMLLNVLTHNIGIISLLNELFYRADRTPLICLPAQTAESRVCPVPGFSHSLGVSLA